VQAGTGIKLAGGGDQARTIGGGDGIYGQRYTICAGVYCVPRAWNAKRRTLFGVCERGTTGTLRRSLALQKVKKRPRCHDMNLLVGIQDKQPAVTCY
jgi:hypothetical protein